MLTVDEVKVGDRILTPVAKWFRYQEDQTYQAGNGWTQNDVGTWQFDPDKKEFVPESRNGKDEFGAFLVSFRGEKMRWERMENGEKVIVTLSKITEMPMSPKDRIVGNWELISVQKNGEDITESFNPEKKASLLIRWIETYRMTNPDGSQAYGYWHMDAHAPEFHLIDFDRTKDVQVYVVSFKTDTLTMKSKNDEVVLMYKKI